MHGLGSTEVVISPREECDTEVLIWPRLSNSSIYNEATTWISGSLVADAWNHISCTPHQTTPASHDLQTTVYLYSGPENNPGFAGWLEVRQLTTSRRLGIGTTQRLKPYTE